MKNLLIAFVLLLTVSSCLPDKIGKKDPEPELAGTYQMTRYVEGNKIYIPDDTDYSGTVNVTKKSDTELSISVTINVGGTSLNLGSYDNATITKSSGSAYDILDNGTRVGSINGTNLSASYLTNTGARVSLSAKK
ncbi:hypothetical protein ACFSUS_06430 [Spirosoma soli]|uniref:Lipocalin-like domain-containing protein n=1 Tax=Spirosoma soli TaxID=1770529 RepID=A0ABW5M077_9BACT